MPDQIEHAIKRDRMDRLVDLVQKHALERAQRFVGRDLEVLVEGRSRKDPSKVRGRTRHNKVVNFDGLAEAGELTTVQIERATSQTLGGSEKLLARALA
jgi:tRNA-2-methylthio-N6-dimethylallyladenosine synthase